MKGKTIRESTKRKKEKQSDAGFLKERREAERREVRERRERAESARRKETQDGKGKAKLRDALRPLMRAKKKRSHGTVLA